MPINIPNNLPAREILEKENIFVMTQKRANHQDIRPLKIVILNLMPTKIQTETQLLRLLGNTPLQVEVTFLHTKTYKSQNISQEHLVNFYKNFDDLKHLYFDGMIITGAPVENMDFEDVTYWDELTKIMEWTKCNVFSTLHICWAAQAGLYYHYGVNKYPLKEKKFGVFKHSIEKKNIKLLRGYDDNFYAPHSRYTEILYDDIVKIPELIVLSVSDEAGVYIIKSRGGKQIFVTGHSEYDSSTLKTEYERDCSNGIEVNVPKNYFPKDNPKEEPIVKWRGHANLLFSNWLNYYVYQETPYDLRKLT